MPDLCNGALGAFLRAVDDGMVKPGEHLLVENLDRVSRQNPWKALPVFQEIINAGVIVVTLQDRRRHSKEILEANPFLIMESVLSMLRARQESDAKRNGSGRRGPPSGRQSPRNR